MKRRNNIHVFILLAMALLMEPLCAVAQSEPPKEKVDVKGIVFEHLGDSYTWHILTWGEKEIGVHLPVIVRSNNGGWHIFSSAHLHGDEAYNGFHIAHNGKHKDKIVELNEAGEEVRPSIDISFTKNALALLMTGFVLLLLIMPLARWYRRGTMKPAKGFMGAIEMLLVDVYNEVIKPCIGPDYKKFAPYLLTAFFFIFTSNLIGLIPFFPGGANLTGNIAITMVLALCTFFAVNLSGTKEYWKEILWPEVPTWLKAPAPIMPAIELFGIFTKPFALMIRLFANIMAGHSVILGLTCLIFITASMGPAINSSMSVVAILFSCFMLCLELLVAYIQAYVFTLLSSVFIGMARAKHETEHLSK